MARKLTVVALAAVLAGAFLFTTVSAGQREVVPATDAVPTQEAVEEDEARPLGDVRSRSTAAASIEKGPTLKEVLLKVAAPLAGGAGAYGVSYLTTPEFTEEQIADEAPVPLSKELLSATGIASLAAALGLLGFGAYQAGKLGYKKYRASLRGKRAAAAAAGLEEEDDAVAAEGKEE